MCIYNLPNNLSLLVYLIIYLW